MTIDLPENLIALERSAWEEIQAGTLTVDTAAAVQAAVSEYAVAAGIGRYEAEMALKKAVRHPEPAKG
ncbi:hypothetical protein [Streptomyces sp. NPDC088794]|uniref:hypothetical protein n=1 Tax=Streptomyces sp. NPDC088794 TaxID=3365902 RepID=UPI00382567ED